MNDRLKDVRKALKMSQDEFAERIGMKGSSISMLESGKRNMTEQVVKAVCKEYNVDYLWMTTGEGEMFTDLPETILDELAIEYGLTEEEKELTKEFLSLTKEERAVLMKFLRPAR
ncbi:MAG: helix-turn-helix transcriptional regulator [Hespellia sp.]|nr:helix-turn-helix transcriptional regulator [Hespellia sp.]